MKFATGLIVSTRSHYTVVTAIVIDDRYASTSIIARYKFSRTRFLVVLICMIAM